MPFAPLSFLGLPSLHDVVEAVAGGFFQTLAEALVPSFLKHASVATIQQLVALPDPASWAHVGQLQQEMVFLGAMLLPVTLAAGTVRYLLVGLTGEAYQPVPAARCVWVTGVLVGYRWIVEQTVAAVNTLTHGILALPAVGDGLQRLVGILFGGALLTGTGGVFGALLVIVGVVFAAGLFAAQVLLTLALALVIVAGPPVIALGAVPELSHLAGAWGRALLALALIPLGWTVLFATAGALTLDATSFAAGGGLPGEVAAAFAALITFVLAVRLPWVLLGSLRRVLAPTGAFAASSSTAGPVGGGAVRVSRAFARLRGAGVQGTLSLGRSAGAAAGALGAPAGGLAGIAARRMPRPRDPGHGARPGGATESRSPDPRGARGRIRRAGVVVRRAPSLAREAARRSSGKGEGSRPSWPAGGHRQAAEAPRGQAAHPPRATAPTGRRARPRQGPPAAEGAPRRAPAEDARPAPTAAPPSRASGSSPPGSPSRRADGPSQTRPSPETTRNQPRPSPGRRAPRARPDSRVEKRSPPPPPGGADPVRPARPRKPDRRPRKKGGR